MKCKECVHYKLCRDLFCQVDTLTNDDKKCDYFEQKRPHGEWIPCFERLPEESLNSVIGWDRFRERCVFVQYMDGHFQITGKQESFDIIAWMPLPEPYKKEGDEK